MNLLTDPWIPIRRRSGLRERIRPSDLTSRHEEDPVIDLASPRPDFDGALAQFLIGIVQTRFAPENGREWRRRFDQPPSPEELSEAWSGDVEAFWIDGERRRFGQEFELMGSDAKSVDVSPLLPEFPGAQSLKFNTDHFVKRVDNLALCLPCAAASVFSIQTNSPAGGKGYRTGLRGGGPLSTLILGANLWESTWLNVLEGPDFLCSRYGNVSRNKQSDIFPWMASLRTSDKDPKGKQSTYPDHVHPAQVFWSMPQRLWLEIENHDKGCSLCAENLGLFAVGTMLRPSGVNYWDQFSHPLSPYSARDGEPRTPIKGQPRGLSYRDWLGHIYRDPKTGREPAHAVAMHLTTPARQRRANCRLWVFGYDMDNAKARSWLDSRVPLLLPRVGSEDGDDRRGHYAELIRQLVDSSAYCLSALSKHIKEALARRPGDLKGDFSFLDHRFLELTTPSFEEAQVAFLETCKSDQPQIEALQSWLQALRKAGRMVFEEIVRPEGISVLDAGRASRAWNSLNKTLWGKGLRDLLGIPKDAGNPAKAGGGVSQ